MSNRRGGSDVAKKNATRPDANRPGQQTAPEDSATPGTVERDVERGSSGTPNYGGFISGEDYNPKLDGINAFPVYEEMRRSDAQVRATLDVLKLPLISATW